MSQRVAPIARIRLARSGWRVLAIPMLQLASGGVAVGAGLLLVPGIAGVAVAALGAVVAVIGLTTAIVLLSVHLEVEESAVTVAWLGGGRSYPLTPGPVTRVRFHGANASKLRRGFTARAWGIGGARLRGEEAIEIVRLAPTPTAILVPTERGRLAIAPARDDDLLDALSRAARARRRLDALVESPPVEAEPAAAEPDVEPDVGPDMPAVEPGAVAEPEEPPVILTGIERALLEQRLADERQAEIEAHTAAAAIAAEAERLAAERATSMTVAEIEEEAPARPAPTGRRGRLSLRRPRPRAAFVLLPIVGAGIAWGIGVAGGRMPEPGTDLARLTSLALVLAGPATSVGALMALAFWPRMVGVVVAGGLAASVFVGRALIGA